MTKRFRDKFNDHMKVKAEPGVGIKQDFVGRYDDRGRLVLVPNGQTDMYSYIQSFADSVDIHVLMKRYRAGDIEALSKVQGFYGDISNLPTTMMDMVNKMKVAEDAFNDLDVETRAAFNHSLTEFLAGAGSEEWCNKLGIEYVAPKKKGKTGKSTTKVNEPAKQDSVPEVKSEGGATNE